MSIELTWDEVRARSERNGCFCFDCYLCFEAVQMPCLKHCANDEERKERDGRFLQATKRVVEGMFK